MSEIFLGTPDTKFIAWCKKKCNVTEIISVTQEAYGGKEPPAPGEVAYCQGALSIKGINLKLSPGDYVSFEATYQGQPVDTDITDDITTNTDTELKTPRGFSNSSDITDAEWASLNALLVIRKKGVRYTFPVRFADDQEYW